MSLKKGKKSVGTCLQKPSKHDHRGGRSCGQFFPPAVWARTSSPRTAPPHPFPLHPPVWERGKQTQNSLTIFIEETGSSEELSSLSYTLIHISTELIPVLRCKCTMCQIMCGASLVLNELHQITFLLKPDKYHIT